MSSEWPIVRLGEHVDSFLGKMLDAKKNKGIAQRYLGNSNVRWGNFDLSDLAEMRFESHEEERYGLLRGDLVVCEGGEPGRCAIWTGAAGMKIQKALHRIRPKSTFNNYYLYYWMCHAANRGSLEQHFTGTTIKHLTGKAIAALEVPCPPIEVQLAIVDVLKTLDDRITLLRETNSTLEAIAQALFKSWFVDFDPVHAKMHGRAPEGIDEATAELFPDSFEKSELGAVPKGWHVKSLDAVASFLNGLALQKFPPTGDKDLPVIKIAQLRKGDTVGADLASRSIKPEYVIQNGDVLFSWSGSLEVEIWCGGEGALNQHLFKVTSEVFPKWFYFLWTRHHLEHFRQVAASKATTMGHIQRAHLTGAKVLVPSDGVLRAANSVLEPIMQRLIENSLQAYNLAALRDTLLPRLISGQLSVIQATMESEA
jgi:type I restriction enzyme S subunit